MATTLEPPNYFTLLPRENYISPEVYERELERILRHQWTFAAHESQLPEPGDYVVEEIAGESLVLVRGDDGDVNAFFNVCRHRGHPFCREAQGSVKRFICPYHQWSYRRDGSLAHAPASPDGEYFDYADWGLHRAHVERWHGLIFVSMARSEPADLGAALDRQASDMLPAHPERVREAARETYVVDANWKVFLENFLECYHCLGVHRELCSTMSTEAISTANRDEWIGEFIGGGTPMKQGRKTMSLDGELVSLPLGDFAGQEQVPDGYTAGFVIVPFLTRIIAHVDHLITHVLRPLDVGRSRWETRWYVNDAAVEGVDYDVERLTEVWAATNQQDLSLVEGAYRGVLSSRWVSGPLHVDREPAIRSALEQYRELMA